MAPTFEEQVAQKRMDAEREVRQTPAFKAVAKKLLEDPFADGACAVCVSKDPEGRHYEGCAFAGGKTPKLEAVLIDLRMGAIEVVR